MPVSDGLPGCVQGALAVVPGPPSRPGGPPDTVAEVAALIRSYGGQYLQRGQADVALDYYVAAAVTAGRPDSPGADLKLKMKCVLCVHT